MGNLISNVLEILLEKNPDRLDGICDFRCKWSKAAMIAREQKTNYKKIRQGLYVNCNHTA